MRTKDVVGQSGTSREVLRFYERLGLISHPKRSASGYREYSIEALRQLHFIKVAKEIGFTLQEIKSFVSLGNRSVPREFVVQSIETKLVAINCKLLSLKRIKKALEGLRTKAVNDKNEFLVCPILGKIDIKSKPKQRGHRK